MHYSFRNIDHGFNLKIIYFSFLTMLIPFNRNSFTNLNKNPYFRFRFNKQTDTE